MGLVSVGPTWWPPPFNGVSIAPNAHTIDAADEVAHCVFDVPKTGTVVRIHFRTATVTTGGDVDVRLETVNGSGEPSGTLFGTNTNVTHTINSADDNAWLRTNALTGSASVTVGQQIALAIVNPSSSFGSIQIARSVTCAMMPGYPYSGGPLRTNKTDQGQPLVCALEYDDGSFAVPDGVWPLVTVSQVALNTGTNPDEAGIVFVPPVPMRAVGWYALAQAAAGADHRMQLYESGNNTPLAKGTYDGDLATTAGNQRGRVGRFDAAVELAAGTTYRLAALPTTANSFTLAYWEISSSYLGLFDAVAGGQSMHYTARNRTSTTDPDSAAWSQTTNRRAVLGLLVDQFHDGTGGGGGGGLKLVGTGGLAA